MDNRKIKDQYQLRFQKLLKKIAQVAALLGQFQQLLKTQVILIRNFTLPHAISYTKHCADDTSGRCKERRFENKVEFLKKMTRSLS